MKYEFGIADYMLLLLDNTAVNSIPHFVITLKEEIDKERLASAIRNALKTHPIFATRLVTKGGCYLENNDAELVIFDYTADGVRDFGKATNGYLWRVAVDKAVLHFDFCHAVTDGRGMTRFVSTILEYYFGLDITSHAEEYTKGYEAVYDKSVKPLGMIKQPKGFSSKELPHIKNGEPTAVTAISFNTSELLQTSKNFEATPTALLLPLLSKAFYQILPKGAQNRNVRGYFTADFRDVMKLETGRNFIGYRYITYTDRFDKLEMNTLTTVYRSMIDLFMQEENITDFCNNFIDTYSALTKIKPFSFANSIAKLIAPITKSNVNAYVTYLGKLPFSPELCAHIEDVDLIEYPDLGYCVMAAADFNGTMKLTVTNNYKTDKLIPNLLKLFKKNNINAKCEEAFYFKQAKLTL